MVATSSSSSSGSSVSHGRGLGCEAGRSGAPGVGGQESGPAGRSKREADTARWPGHAGGRGGSRRAGCRWTGRAGTVQWAGERHGAARWAGKGHGTVCGRQLIGSERGGHLAAPWTLCLQCCNWVGFTTNIFGDQQLDFGLQN